MGFEFATATRVVFGPGTVTSAGRIAASLGTRAFVVTGRSPARAGPLLAALDAAGVGHVTFAVPGEPTIGLARDATGAAREAGCDVVIGFGGGSAIDAGKAVAALVTNGGDPLDYLEVVGAGRPIRVAPLPLVAIPTTAGTGSEVTRNAVLSSPDHRVKASLRSPRLLPMVAIVDPDLTLGLPPDATAWTGLDALTQLVEPYVGIRANPMTDALCRVGMIRVARSLRRVCEAPDDAAAREDMALASLFGGMALANASLGAVHGFAAVIGGLCGAPHGAVCARLLAPVMEANLRAIEARGGGTETLHRYEEIGRVLTGRPDAMADDGVAWADDLCQSLRVPTLSAWGLGRSDFPRVVADAANASSMKGNPVSLTAEEMTEVLRQAL